MAHNYGNLILFQGYYYDCNQTRQLQINKKNNFCINFLLHVIRDLFLWFFSNEDFNWSVSKLYELIVSCISDLFIFSFIQITVFAFVVWKN